MIFHLIIQRSSLKNSFFFLKKKQFDFQLQDDIIKKNSLFPFPLTNQFTTKKKDPSVAWIKLDIIYITEPQYRK